MIIDQIKKDLSNLGLRKGGSLLVHSSLRAIGNFDDRARILVNSLLHSLGNEGTLLMPALSYESVTEENPYFDVNKTPSCVGGLTEYFRTKENVIRSVHPTHSVCGIGPDTEDLLKAHINCKTPAGKDSPYRKLRERKGQILFIGCGLRPNTSMHAIEELVEPPYLFRDYTEFKITLSNGEKKSSRIRCHDFDGWKQRYDRLENVISENSLRKGKILDADCYLVETDEMWNKVHQKLLDNPLYFVDKK